ncbi:RNA 3'-terminal phosphate cyclase [Duganella sp. FT92W]|uniref:RNA 3'-terminal phosphate cyclase n=1 Tax=Pseudoduganella rivuli TaxID=2666085 RepID=A0A7X2IVI6_9BURK|nr:RNA 3'-terminal phosphate cyclase [Pseudoduganella rivuli]MRV76715.1 RNA 3'-terminal phosphate cyclase [Pseudoduganella rivuli]
MIELDGSQGEGGGQILRTSLSLSMITGQPVRIVNIRANRAKPGLMRQHLVAVQAAAEVCGADISDVQVGAQTLVFKPGRIRGGNYSFAIGSAGSSMLVLQTLLPALLYADQPSTVTVSGGTHNPKAPPAEFLQRAYGRAMAEMGARIDIQLERHGFYPAGGGIVTATVQPGPQLQRLELLEPGARRVGYAESFIAAVPFSVAERELETVATAMGWSGEQLRPRQLPDKYGPGNALLITLDSEHVTEVFAAFGEKSVPAEAVAKQAVHDARFYIASGAAVSEHLADQLMLPMALAGGGKFTVDRVSLHARTNADVIARFLPVAFNFEGQERRSLCTITPAP